MKLETMILELETAVDVARTVNDARDMADNDTSAFAHHAAMAVVLDDLHRRAVDVRVTYQDEVTALTLHDRCQPNEAAPGWRTPLC